MTTSPEHPAIDDASLVERPLPMSSYPAFRGKQFVYSAAALVLVGLMFLPWWDAEIPLDRINNTLNAWLLLGAGFGIPPLGGATGYTWFGNAMFGLVPVLPVVVLVVLLVLRVLRIAVTPAQSIANAAFGAIAGMLWLLLFGVFRVDAANGVYPVMVGPWLVLVVCLAVAAISLVWWRTERAHFPARKWLGFGPVRATDATEPDVDNSHLFDDLRVDDEDDDEVRLGDGLANDAERPAER